MPEWRRRSVLNLVCEETAEGFTAPSQDQRDALLGLPSTPEGHAAALSRHRDLFDRLERVPAIDPKPLTGSTRIGFWNAERGKYLDASTVLLGGLDASVLLLCELDLGMARSGQAHTTKVLATELGMGYAFAVEFLELGLGDARERDWHAGEVNEAGLHGAAILSSGALDRPAVIRLETDGDWFDGRHGERRVGGRIALAGTIKIDGVGITVVSVHFESHGDPDQRARQMQRLLEAIELYAADQPVLVGGDLNTSTLSRDWARGSGVKPVLPLERILDPIPYEPLFAVAADQGYGWRECNALGTPTQRTRPDGTPRAPLGKIDWFLSRDLATADPRTVPAVDANGHTISDHEVLLVTIAPQPSSAGSR